MSLVPRLIDAIMGEPLDDLYPVIVHPSRRGPYPRRAWGQMNSAYNELTDLTSQFNRNVISAQRNSIDRFEVNLDCGHFRPEEITVKLVGDSLVVEGKHEERNDPYGYVAREFKRRFVVPNDIDKDKFESQLGIDGVLKIKAPRKIVSLATGEKQIPITLIDDVTKPITDNIRECNDPKQKPADKMEN
ncbi:alpha-crystallin A chain [Tetranychus urticae]|uniref:SHSP domain-containing protein n=1 Tax=Tetranychus urticae TaxID=32264 RepID=T1JYK0_TETUR|nr:alpha-crystallin A chain [Tetranychus urticae]